MGAASTKVEISPVNRITGAYVDKELENSYRLGRLKVDNDMARRSVLAVGILYIMFILSDFSLLGITNDFYLSLLIRIIVLVSTLCISIFLNKSKTVAYHNSCIILFAFMLSSAIGFHFLLYFQLESIEFSLFIYAAVYYFYVLVMFVIFTSSIIIASIINCFYLMSFISVATFNGDLDDGLFLSSMMFFIVSFTIGLLTSNNLQNIRRTNWSLLLQEKELSKDLSEKILLNKTLQLELIKQASTDPLTGAFNRRELMKQLEVKLGESKRHNLNLFVLFLDLDHFKKINDTYGHNCGDAVLKSTADVITNSIRKSDVFGRIGGEEFALLLPNINSHEAEVAAEKIRRIIEDNKIEWNEHTIYVTVSIGVSGYDKTNNIDEVESIINLSDMAMYEAKANGRNQVVMKSHSSGNE